MVASGSYDRKKLDAIKSQLTIEKYFSHVIKPQLADYYSDVSSNSDLSYVDVVRCPLHTEDTPSFRYYRDTESFYCFGCRKGGDVVTLHREFISTLTLSKPSFALSVEQLYNMFIANGTLASDGIAASVGTTAAGKKGGIEKSTGAEMVAFGICLNELESLLIKERSLPLERKVQLYKDIDAVEKLVYKNIVNASEAKEWLKDKRKEIMKGGS